MQHRIPAFPDSGRTHFHFIQPARIFFIQQQPVCFFRESVIRQRGAQIGRTHKTGVEPEGIFFHFIEESLFYLFPEILRHQAEGGYYRVGGLVSTASLPEGV